MWKPLTPRHAIDTMAMVITFAEPLSSLVFRRLIRELEPTTFAHGLTNRQPMQTVAVNFTATGAAPQVQQAVAPGMQFQKVSLVRINEEAVANKSVEELVTDPGHLLYRNMNYSRWTTVSNAYWAMTSEAVASILNTVPLRTIRVEYLDRFLYDGDPLEATAHGVIKEGSNLITPHIFDQTDLWHSHTGKLEKTAGDDRRLYQLNVDMVDIAEPESASKRSIMIMSAVEERFAGQGREGETVASLRAIFDDLHIKAKELFKNVVHSDMLAAVGLEND